MPVCPDPALAEALRLLGKERLLLAVHDASFPGVPGRDTGRGSPYGLGAQALAETVRGLGFTGLQLGPQGQTSSGNPSPYDGTLFSRSFLSLDLPALAHDPQWGELLEESVLEEVITSNPRPDGGRVPYAHVHRAYGRAIDNLYRRFVAARRLGEPLAARLEDERAALWRDSRWLRDDALYAALTEAHGQLPWWQWPETGAAAPDRLLGNPPPGRERNCAMRRAALERTHAEFLEKYSLVQVILIGQHRAFRARMGALGLKLYGDVQVGFSIGDVWARQGLLMEGYFMGAPPSRTNLEGQPWRYQVLDPARYLTADGRPGQVLAFVAERLGKMLAEFDGLRLDHPHGLVCPWVYRADDPDPYHAVQNGARLFSAPNLPDHPALAAHAIVRPEQINRDRPRYADDWERELEPAQVDRFALLMDALMEQAQAHGRDTADILCEVLSTQPYPLGRVRERHGLGRFRVTQKADLDDPADVYRSENAAPEDWVMVGNHDTPSIWRLAKAWQGTAMGARQAAYLADRLGLSNPETLMADPVKLAHAKVADLFLSPARNVQIFFADLFGLDETYNMPGTVSPDNWTLRVPADFADKSRNGPMLNVPACLALAVRAKTTRPDLADQLDTLAGWRTDEEMR